MHRNIVRIKAVASLLAPLKEKVVFVGGATVSLYATHEEAVAEVRPTEQPFQCCMKITPIESCHGI